MTGRQVKVIRISDHVIEEVDRLFEVLHGKSLVASVKSLQVFGSSHEGRRKPEPCVTDSIRDVRCEYKLCKPINTCTLGPTNGDSVSCLYFQPSSLKENRVIKIEIY